MRDLVCASAAAAVLLVAVPVAAQDASEPPMTLTRLGLDPAFGDGGVVREIPGDPFDALVAVELDAVGRIVVAGRDGGFGGVHVARFLPDGARDASFGAAGVATLPARGSVKSLALDARGRILVSGGFARDAETWLTSRTVRLTADGALDLTFSDDGFADFGGVLRAHPMDGTVVIGLRASDVEGPAGPLVRLRDDGRPDPEFAGAVELRPWVDAWSWIIDLEIDDRGSVVVALASLYGTAFVDRYDANGVREPFAAGFGFLGEDRGAPINASDLAIDASGRIVVASWRQVHRFLRDGTRDASFGTDGRVLLPDLAPARARAEDPLLRIAGDRYVLARPLSFPAKHRRSVTGRGVLVTAFDADAPRAPATFDQRIAPAPVGWVLGVDVAVTPDGAAAIVVGAGPFLARVDLTGGVPVGLPDPAVRWVGDVTTTFDRTGGTLHGALRVENSGRGRMPSAALRLFVSEDDVLDAGDVLVPGPESSEPWAPIRVRALRPRRSTVVRFALRSPIHPGLLIGRRLIAELDPGAGPQVTTASDTAVLLLGR